MFSKHMLGVSGKLKAGPRATWHRIPCAQSSRGSHPGMGILWPSYRYVRATLRHCFKGKPQVKVSRAPSLFQRLELLRVAAVRRGPVLPRRGTAPAEAPRSGKGLSLSAEAAEGVSVCFIFGYIRPRKMYFCIRSISWSPWLQNRKFLSGVGM